MKKIWNKFFNLGAAYLFWLTVIVSLFVVIIGYSIDDDNIWWNNYLSVLLGIFVFMSSALMFYRLIITGDPIDKDEILSEEFLSSLPEEKRKKYLEAIAKKNKLK
tara:strand:+ start:544 stop:858 length:315 start_codon:yes stop_codon:yes gene_type:complete